LARNSWVKVIVLVSLHQPLCCGDDSGFERGVLGSPAEFIQRAKADGADERNWSGDFRASVNGVDVECQKG
jgi:hypothetical protein